ncbi:hypothetical protein RUM43_004436, partial [Polyplax serrata]
MILSFVTSEVTTRPIKEGEEEAHSTWEQLLKASRYADPKKPRRKSKGEHLAGQGR